MNKPRYVKGTRRNFGCKSHRVLKVFKRFFVLTAAALLCLAAAVCYKVGPIIWKWYKESNAIADCSIPKDFRSTETSYLYAADGTQLMKLQQGKGLIYVSYSEMPQSVLDAFIAIEDKRFYEHHGVDWLSTAKAVYLLLKTGEATRGGSTITQQLARNVYLTFEKSYERKIREIFLALALEDKYSKEQILEFYINNINYSNHYYGIGAAAKGYFGKEVGELSVSEAAFLSAIPNNPTYYDPVKNFDHTVARRNLILGEMYEQGYLGKKEYLEACNSPICLCKNSEEYCDYAASYALDCAIREFMQKTGFVFQYSFESDEDYRRYREKYLEAYDEAKTLLYTGGYKVYTSMNTQIQSKLQTVVDTELSGFEEVSERGDYEIQGAASVIDNETGLVIASIGGRTPLRGGGYLNLNRAFQSYRQPGSTIKPLIVYTPALEHGYTADSIVSDTPIEDGPQNVDGYLGDITLREAVEKSKNVVAWQLLQELNPRIGIRYVQDMHFSRIMPEDYTLAASLGGLTYGVTTEEMAGAYAALYHDGEWDEPTCIISIKDSKGNEIYAPKEPVKVYTKESADAMKDILLGVPVNGTAKGIFLEGGHQFACKTGTTNENRAAWFCGFTNYYTVAVYVGADDNRSVDGLWGSAYPAQVWAKMQDALLVGKEPVSLEPVLPEPVLPEPVPEAPAPLLGSEPEPEPVPEPEEPLPQEPPESVLPEEPLPEPAPEVSEQEESAPAESPEPVVQETEVEKGTTTEQKREPIAILDEEEEGDDEPLVEN